MHRTYAKVAATVASLSMLVGCADLFGLVLNVQPGETAKLIAASANQVTYEYTHSYSWELQAVGQKAEAQCNRYQKHAELGPITVQTMDRSMVTLFCN